MPDQPWAEGRPQYVTHFVVARDSRFQRLEDTFRHRFAYTIEDSHSGYNAPRHHLLRYWTGSAPLYHEIIGPLTTQRRMLEAIAEGKTDVGPLDSYAYALLERHAPELTAATRVIASTEPVQIPCLVASRGIEPKVVARLREAVLALAGEASAEAQAIRADVAVRGFSGVDRARYALAETWAREAEANGATTIRGRRRNERAAIPSHPR